MSITLAIIADTHFDNWSRFSIDPFMALGLEDAIKQRNPDLLIVAGDLANHPQFSWPKVLERLGQIISPEKIVIMAGNHDYYGFRLDGDHLLREMCSEAGMRFAQQDEIRVGKTRVLCCTLWSDFELTGNFNGAVSAAERSMNDYNHIQIGKVPGLPFDQQEVRQLVAKDTLKLHYEHRRWLEDALRRPHFAGAEGATIVVTHHGPSPSTAAGEIDILSASFHSDLDKLILETEPSAWFFGHSHRRCRAKVGKTDIRCVSIGYKREQNDQGAAELQSLMFYETE